MEKARGDAGLSEVREIAVGLGVVSWDGRILETFGFGESSKRIHPATIDSIEITEGRILGPTASINVRTEGPCSIVIGNDPSQRAELEALLAEVEQTRGGFGS